MAPAIEFMNPVIFYNYIFEVEKSLFIYQFKIQFHVRKKTGY